MDDPAGGNPDAQALAPDVQRRDFFRAPPRMARTSENVHITPTAAPMASGSIESVALVTPAPVTMLAMPRR